MVKLVMHLELVLADGSRKPNCLSCTLDLNFTSKKYVLCECKVVFYCSQECADKDKKSHEVHCTDYQKVVKAYRKSIKWVDRKYDMPTKAEKNEDKVQAASTCLLDTDHQTKAGHTPSHPKKKKKKKKGNW